MIMPHSRRRWGRLWILAASAALLIGVLAPVGRSAMASVTLNYFRATWQPDLETVVIEWQTATELNTVGFIVQRSTSPSSGFADITEVIPAVGDQLSGWTYDPVADDPTTIVLGTTYWYRLIVINSSPPNDEIAPVAVLAGEENTVTPTNTATATATSTPTATPTRTRTPAALSSPTATAKSSSSVPAVTPTVTFVSISGATVTPRPGQSLGATATTASASPITIRTATPASRPVATSVPAAVSPLATPDTPAQIAQPPTAIVPTAVLPTLVPTNATFVAVAPIVVEGDSTTSAEAAPESGNPLMLVLIGAAGVLLLGGVYAILRQTSK